MRKHIFKIEVAAILILTMLLSIRFGGGPEYAESFLDSQHYTPRITEGGYIIMDDYVYQSEIGNTEQEKVHVGSDIAVGGLLVGSGSGKDDASEGASEDGTTEQMPQYSKEVMDLYQSAVSYDIPKNIAFANVRDSLSIRKEANGDSKQIGIMYPGNYCIVESVEGEWAKVKTGSVSGYCRVKYLIRGEEAVDYAKKHVACTALTTANVNIRSGATTMESNILTSVGSGKKYTVITPAVLTDDPDAPLFVEISYDGGKAYLAMGKVKLSYSWTAGKTYAEKVKVEVQTQTVQKDEGKNETETETERVTGDTKEIAQLRKTIVSTAKNYIGLKYVYGGTSLTKGCDCSGFIHAIFKKVGAKVINDMPRSSNPMSKSTLGKKITYQEAKPGDLMFYGSGGKSTVDHVAIYIGDGKIIHEDAVAGKVTVSDWDYRVPLLIKNFLGD